MSENLEKRLKRGIKEMGLDALLSDIQMSAVQVKESSVIQNVTGAHFLGIPLDQIHTNPEQPRQSFDSDKLMELADSIRSQGIIQPILVRPLSEGAYQIIAGERRFRAAKLAGLKEIPAMVRDLSDEALIAIGLVENIQRQDLNPIEEAKALQRLADEFGMTHQKIAEVVGKSRVSITNALRLLSLEDPVKQWLEEGLITVGHAKLLMTLTGHEQVRVAQSIIEKSLSVRETEKVLHSMVEGRRVSQKRQFKKPQDPDILRLQNQLSEKLGAEVAIKHTAEGKGKLIVQYNTLSELEGILEQVMAESLSSTAQKNG